MCLCIETERDIAAQILRHRSFSFQEFSTRYAQTSPAAIPSFRRQDDANRQCSHDDLPAELQTALADEAGDLIRQSYLTYQEMLRQGVAKETARRILPLCTPTTLYMHGTLRSWIHYIDLRTEIGTQLEHREIAEACRVHFYRCFPVIAEAVWS